MSVTLKDIARMANVSTATVSRVINNNVKGNMKPETYKRIKKIIGNTGYTPHALASGLRKGQLKVIGVIFPSNVNPYYAQLGHAIENESFSHGYLTLICNSNADVGREKNYISHLLSQKVSGILLCSTGLSVKEIEKLVPTNINVILLDEEVSDFRGDIVIGNDYLGGYMGAEYLFKLGHRRILFVNGPDTLSSCRNRLHGVIVYMNEKEYSLDPKHVIKGDFTIESAYRGVNEAIRNNIQFSAVFTFNDLMAIGALMALNENNLVVPEDVSVLGYDNIFIDELIKPGITTVATPLEQLGIEAVKMLLKDTSKEKVKGVKVVLEPKIIVRDSCRSIC
jgi:LacI family transcriptional regulator